MFGFYVYSYSCFLQHLFPCTISISLIHVDIVRKSWFCIQSTVLFLLKVIQNYTLNLCFKICMCIIFWNKNAEITEVKVRILHSRAEDVCLHKLKRRLIQKNIGISPTKSAEASNESTNSSNGPTLKYWCEWMFQRFWLHSWRNIEHANALMQLIYERVWFLSKFIVSVLYFWIYLRYPLKVWGSPNSEDV